MNTLVSIPFRDSVPERAVVKVLRDELGEVPGHGWIRLVVERDSLGYGPGTELKSLLSRIGIVPTAGCECLKRADAMDRGGPDWCEQNIDTIVGWLREEATKRGLPFLDAAGRLLVRRAVQNARKRRDQSQG